MYNVVPALSYTSTSVDWSWEYREQIEISLVSDIRECNEIISCYSIVIGCKCALVIFRNLKRFRPICILIEATVRFNTIVEISASGQFMSYYTSRIVTRYLPVRLGSTLITYRSIIYAQILHDALAIPRRPILRVRLYQWICIVAL